MTIAIRLENVSKEFSLTQQAQPRSLQETLLGLFKPKQEATKKNRSFWVLKDINFEVHRGETFSLIGANGSGKSTLLKLITQIIRPTQGRIEIYGRISALLELGTGFHPDLTGRENVYLGGTLAGLSQAEIERTFEEIVDFADIGRFIDVPVSHYSSGMFVRLGFALATHINPDILIVDEVLAVGDASFQKRCIEKILEMHRQGVTILFISHDMSLIRSISDRVAWLKDGSVHSIGVPNSVIQAYLADQRAIYSNKQKSQYAPPHLNKRAEIERVEFLNGHHQVVSVLETGQKATIRIYYVAHERIENPVFGLAIFATDGVQVNGPNTDLANFTIDCIDGRGVIEYRIETLSLLGGNYLVTVGIFDRTISMAYDYCDQAFTFSVKQNSTNEIYGLVYMPAQWQHVSKS